MIWMFATFTIFVSFIAAFAWLLIHLRGNNWYRALAVIGFLTSIPAVALALYMSLGIAMPVGFKYLPTPTGELKLISFKAVPGNGIYLFVDAGDYSVPKFYRIPWSRETAEKLEADQDGQRTINLNPDAEGGALGNWEFSFGDKKARVTNEPPPEIVMEPKTEEHKQGNIKILPPNTED